MDKNEFKKLLGFVFPVVVGLWVAYSFVYVVVSQ
jgi:hypothetical protein